MQNQALSSDQLQRLRKALDGDALAPMWLSEPPALPVEIRAESFGQWLLSQHDRGGWVDELASAARADRGFPRRATPDQVRDRLRVLGADGDAFEQLDDAERSWRNL